MKASCTEHALEYLTDLYVLPVQSCTIPIPFNVPGISSIVSDSPMFGGTVLFHATTNEQTECDALVEEDALTATYDTANQGHCTIYTHTINANIIEGLAETCIAVGKMSGMEVLAVLRNADDQYFLCYPCPGTPGLKYTENMGLERTGSLQISLASLSGFIPIVANPS